MADERKLGRLLRHLDRRLLWILPAVILSTTLVYVNFFQHTPKETPVNDSEIGISPEMSDSSPSLVPLMTDEQFEAVKKSFAANGLVVSRSGKDVHIVVPEKMINKQTAQKSMQDLAETTRLQLGADAVVSILDDKGKSLAKSAPRL